MTPDDGTHRFLPDPEKSAYRLRPFIHLQIEDWIRLNRSMVCAYAPSLPKVPQSSIL